jgi:hypothetical protein
MQAVEVPVLKATMVAALAFGAYAMPARTHHHHHHRGHAQQHLLVLHAPVHEHYLYLTAWSNGSFMYPVDVDDMQPIHFAERAQVSDGCEWLAEETLTPTDDHRYAYSYVETILSCAPDATPAIKTPRTGFVTLDQ